MLVTHNSRKNARTRCDKSQKTDPRSLWKMLNKYARQSKNDSEIDRYII